MPYDRETGLFQYRWWEVSSINLAFADARGNRDVLYEQGIDFYKKGRHDHTVTYWRDIAEFICDYERAAKRFGRNPSKRTNGYFLNLYVKFLNGER